MFCQVKLVGSVVGWCGVGVVARSGVVRVVSRRRRVVRRVVVVIMGVLYGGRGFYMCWGILWVILR